MNRKTPVTFQSYEKEGEEEYEEDDDNAWEAYTEMVEWELHYHAHEFDENNEEDISVLEDSSEGKFFQI